MPEHECLFYFSMMRGSIIVPVLGLNDRLDLAHRAQPLGEDSLRADGYWLRLAWWVDRLGCEEDTTEAYLPPTPEGEEARIRRGPVKVNAPLGRFEAGLTFSDASVTLG